MFISGVLPYTINSWLVMVASSFMVSLFNSGDIVNLFIPKFISSFIEYLLKMFRE